MTKHELIAYLQGIPGNPIIQSVDREGQLSTEVEIAWNAEIVTISADEQLEDDDDDYLPHDHGELEDTGEEE